MSDFEEFEDENADDKIKADIESSDKMVRADAIARLAQKTAESGNTARAIVYLESCADLRTEIEDFTGLTFARIQLDGCTATKSTTSWHSKSSCLL
jgi:hypothetical protein